MYLSNYNTVYAKAEIISVRSTPYGMWEFAVLLDGKQYEYPKYGEMTKQQALQKCKQDYFIKGAVFL